MTAGIKDSLEAVIKNTGFKKGMMHKAHTANIKTYNSVCSFLFRLLTCPPIKYPLAKPPNVIAITELHTYKLLPKNGANNLAPQISAAITEAPSTKEIVYNLFL